MPGKPLRWRRSGKPWRGETAAGGRQVVALLWWPTASPACTRLPSAFFLISKKYGRARRRADRSRGARDRVRDGWRAQRLHTRTTVDAHTSEIFYAFRECRQPRVSPRFMCTVWGPQFLPNTITAKPHPHNATNLPSVLYQLGVAMSPARSRRR